MQQEMSRPSESSFQRVGIQERAMASISQEFRVAQDFLQGKRGCFKFQILVDNLALSIWWPPKI